MNSLQIISCQTIEQSISIVILKKSGRERETERDEERERERELVARAGRAGWQAPPTLSFSGHQLLSVANQFIKTIVKLNLGIFLGVIRSK